MTRSRLWNAYLKFRRFPDLATHAYKAYTAQRNIVTKMNKRIKKDHFSKAMQNANSSPKDLWKLCKPFMSNKGISEVGSFCKVLVILSFKMIMRYLKFCIVILIMSLDLLIFLNGMQATRLQIMIQN